MPEMITAITSINIALKYCFICSSFIGAKEKHSQSCAFPPIYSVHDSNLLIDVTRAIHNFMMIGTFIGYILKPREPSTSATG